jgi:hypothetical protein
VKLESHQIICQLESRIEQDRIIAQVLCEAVSQLTVHIADKACDKSD